MQRSCSIARYGRGRFGECASEMLNTEVRAPLYVGNAINRCSSNQTTTCDRVAKVPAAEVSDLRATGL